MAKVMPEGIINSESKPSRSEGGRGRDVIVGEESEIEGLILPGQGEWK